jgi:putative zinc finger protein
MCEFSGKLIGWMDCELPEGEAVNLEQHVAECTECRLRLAAYEQTSGAFDAYCEAIFAAETRRKLPRWLPAAGVTAGIAAAATIAALLMLPHGHLAQIPTRVPAQAARAAGAPHTAERTQPLRAAAPINRPRRQFASAAPAQTRNGQRATAAELVQPPQVPNVSSFPAEPAIEIAIPADAMFPPGAVPPGMSFTAELTISADGSAERLRLRPRLAGFERRTNQP